MSKKKFTNVNPRLGVLLKHGNASVRLYNLLNPRFGMRGLKWFQKNWPDSRLRKELYGWGEKTRTEWCSLLENRPHAGVEVAS